MTLQEIKDQYAKEYIGHENATWEQFVAICLEPLEDHMDSICVTYALECCKASLEKAADNAEAEYLREETSIVVSVLEESITHPENIVLC